MLEILFTFILSFIVTTTTPEPTFVKSDSATSTLHEGDCRPEIYGGAMTKSRYKFECGFDNILPISDTGVSSEYKNELTNSFSEGGLFEVFIKNKWENRASDICPVVIVRMPWSDEDVYPEMISEKYSFFTTIQDKIKNNDVSTVNAHLMIPIDSALHSSYDANDHSGEFGENKKTQCLIYFAVDSTSGAYLSE